MISIIVPCYNHISLTKDFLNSVWNSTHHSYEVILVDDGSSDATKNLHQDELGITTLIRHNNNLGFPCSVNDGIRASKGEYLAIFNNDVVVKKDWDLPLIKALEKYPAMGMVMGKCISPLEEQSTIITNKINVWDRGLPFFLRKEIQLELGQWDERYYPSWFDDIDMEIRLVRSKYFFGVAEDSECTHFGSQTLGEGVAHWDDYKTLSAERFKEKWLLNEASAFLNFEDYRQSGYLETVAWDEYHRMVYSIEGGL
jgi:GT2 family glycosyltransferase